MPPSDPRQLHPPVAPGAEHPPEDIFVYPASFAQERIWFLDQLEPGTTSYNFTANRVLHGRLHVEGLRRALEEVIRRHEVLRTTFQTENGRPVQVVAPARPLTLPVRDLRTVPRPEADSEVARVATEEARRPFDLAEGPLLRTSLLWRGEEEHVLVLVFHHIVFDGWSIGVFFRELSDLYEAFSSGRASGLPDLPIQYADYAVWQRDWLQGEVLERQLAYWKAALAGAPLSLALPTDRPRPPVQSFRGSSWSRVMPESLRNGLVALSQREGVTLFMTLLASFQVLLARHANQQDILVGSPVAGRNRLELEGLIGFFVNTLVMRGDLSGDPTFRQLLGRVREMALGAYAHQDLPFERLVEELQPERTLSHTPLFQVMFQMGEHGPSETNWSTLRVQRFGLQAATSKFDLTCRMVDSSKQLSCFMEYAADLFEAETVGRLLERFEVLLSGIVANPDERVSRLPLLTEAEQHQVLVEWNETAVSYPRDETVHGLFEAQVERSPQSVAVEWEGEGLTYGQLNARSNQLASHLEGLGVGPEVLIGLCMERSLEMVVGLLGILKAGGAYVPLDPTYPNERLSFMLEDTQASVLLTQKRLLEKLPGTTAQILCIDRDWPVIEKHDSHNPRPSAASSQNLAYVIYTSGSTGKPKGVAIEHRSTVTFLHWAREAFAVEDLAGVLASTSVCFDLSVFEIFGPLSWGGRAVLVMDALSLPSLTPSAHVRLVNTVPSALREILRLGPLPASIRTVNLAGEALPQSLVDLIYGQGTVDTVFNLYGPTEDTTYSTWMRVEAGAERGPAIGRPIANTRAYILDGARQPVAIGTAGEVYLAGWGLARGYLNHPELTAETFIADPFAADPGGRLYRTGDLARYRKDGQIEYLGRLDHQVKIRGYRIELGEIEAALAEHPQVRECAVMLREDTRGEPRLVAYLVASGVDEPNATELRRHLQKKLPDYMVPSAFVFLDALPLTSSGKVDRRSLPAPDRTRPGGEGFLPPRTPVEEALAGIWKGILRIDRVGVHDNFFELGGHSLLATQVVSRVAESLGLRMPLRRVFEEPILEGFALAIVQGLAEAERGDEMLRMLTEVGGLSDEEARRRLVAEAQADEKEASRRPS